MSTLKVEKGRGVWLITEQSFFGEVIHKAYNQKGDAVKQARRIAKNRFGRNRLTIESSTGGVQERVTYRNGKPI